MKESTAKGGSSLARYPDVHVHIAEEHPCGYDYDEGDDFHSAENANAAGLLERVQGALREGGASDGEMAACARVAASRCSNRLRFTTMTRVCWHWEASITRRATDGEWRRHLPEPRQD